MTELTGRPVEREYCSTTEAAQLLGVSLGTVQQMAETGLLEAWKTAGGHRRIRVGSIESYLRKRCGQPDHGERLRMLIAEKDHAVIDLYERTLTGWGMQIDLRIATGGFDGLMEIGRQAPHLLVSDLVIPGVDGFEMIRKLRAHPQLTDMDIVVVTELSQQQIDSAGGLPGDVIIYGKPIPFGELKGYVQAKLIQLQKRARIRM